MSTIKVNGAEFYYQLHGQGQPLVLICGYTTDHQRWLPYLDKLTPYFQVLIFDNRAVGQTKDDGGPLSVELMADDVMALCEALQLKKPHIVGHSMGGTIAQNIAVRYPEAISKLAILNSTAKWRQAMLKGLKTTLLMRENNVPFDIIFESILSWVFGEAFLQDQNKVAFLKNLILNNPYPQSVEDQARQFRALEAFDGRANLPKIKAPTLVMFGAEDVVALPSESEALAEAIAGAKLIGIPGAAHVPSVEAPEAFLKALFDFLV